MLHVGIMKMLEVKPGGTIMGSNKHIFFFIAGLFAVIMFQSCFEEDDRVPPKVKGEQTEVSLENSIYDNQIYFDLGSNQVRAVHPNNSWLLAFGTGPEDWFVNINSAGYYGVAPTGKFDFGGVVPLTKPGLYKFDASSGNPDSCSFAGWLDREALPWKPTGEIFLIGKFDGIKYVPEWKLRIDSFDDTSFHISYAKMKGEVFSQTVRKDPDRNLVHVNLKPQFSQFIIEPPKTDWDLLFSQYGTILFTDEGVPTPYFVRGALQNPFKHRIAMDAIVPFDSIDFFQALEMEFSNRLDVIGHDWKEPLINFETNTATYQVRKDSTFIVNDNEGFYYKLRFVNYYSKTGEKGFPGFVYLKL